MCIRDRYTWTDTRVTDSGFETGDAANFVTGGRLIRRPEHGGSVSLSRSIVAGAVLSFGATYIGRREDREFAEDYSATAVTLDAVTTVDLGLDLPVPFTRDWHLVARADNALDARYEMIRGFASPGRTWYLGVRGTR
jgi:vitamin B12 transporter